jgi:hypothetical protein
MGTYIFYKIMRKIKIRDEEEEQMYIGMTRNLSVRKSKHKHNCKNENIKHYNYPVYKYIRANGGWDAFIVIPIETCDFDLKTDASIRERYWFETLNHNLNTQTPSQSNAESCASWRCRHREEYNCYQRSNRILKKNKTVFGDTIDLEEN